MTFLVTVAHMFNVTALDHFLVYALGGIPNAITQHVPSTVVTLTFAIMKSTRAAGAVLNSAMSIVTKQHGTSESATIVFLQK
jgi:hypothetical protein